MTLPELPNEVVGPALSRRALKAAGVSDWELRGPLWQRSYRGLHVWAALELDEPAQRIREAARLLPHGGAVGGWAAAHLLGARELDGRNPLFLARTTEEAASPYPLIRHTRGARGVASGLSPVLLCTGPGNRIRAQPGVILLRSPLAPGDVVDIDGIPVTSPERTAFDLAREIEGQSQGGDITNRLMDAVGDVDALLRATTCEVTRVMDYLVSHAGWRGAPFARRVLALADADALSRTESALRVIWLVEARLPRPVLNRPVYDHKGFLLGYPDLLDPASGFIAESDGSHHRRLDRHTADNAREEGFERHNLHVVRATSIDLYRRRGGLAQRLIAGYRDARARDVRRDDWVVGTEPLRPNRRPGTRRP